MLKKVSFLGTLVGFGFLVGVISGAIPSAFTAPSYTERSTQNTTQFQRIKQPLENNLAVTLGGIGLISVELWWFLFSKPKTQ